MIDIIKIRENIQNQIGWKRVQSVFKIGTLFDNNGQSTLYGVNGSSGNIFALAKVNEFGEVKEIVL